MSIAFVLLALKAAFLIFSVVCGIIDFVVLIWALFWLMDPKNSDDWGYW